MNFTATNDMWTLSYSDLQGLLPSLCQSAWFSWDYREQPCTTWDSSEYEHSLEGKGCLPSRLKKNGPQKLQELSSSFSLTTAAGIRNTWSKRKSSRNKIYPHKSKHCSPAGGLRRMLSMKMLSLLCLRCPPTFLAPNSAKNHFLQEDRKLEKS